MAPDLIHNPIGDEQVARTGLVAILLRLTGWRDGSSPRQKVGAASSPTPARPGEREQGGPVEPAGYSVPLNSPITRITERHKARRLSDEIR